MNISVKTLKLSISKKKLKKFQKTFHDITFEIKKNCFNILKQVIRKTFSHKNNYTFFSKGLHYSLKILKS